MPGATLRKNEGLRAESLAVGRWLEPLSNHVAHENKCRCESQSSVTGGLWNKRPQYTSRTHFGHWFDLLPFTLVASQGFIIYMSCNKPMDAFAIKMLDYGNSLQWTSLKCYNPGQNRSLQSPEISIRSLSLTDTPWFMKVLMGRLYSINQIMLSIYKASRPLRSQGTNILHFLKACSESLCSKNIE